MSWPKPLTEPNSTPALFALGTHWMSPLSLQGTTEGGGCLVLEGQWERAIVGTLHRLQAFKIAWQACELPPRGQGVATSWQGTAWGSSPM